MTNVDTTNTSYSDERRTQLALLIVSVFVVGEIVAGLFAHSLALLSDAGHMITDVGALALTVGSLRLSRRPARGSFTYGYRRSEVISAAINGVLLAAVGVAVTVEAIVRLVHPTHVDGGVVLVVALAGAAANGVVTLILRGANHQRLNIRAALVHVVTDFAAFGATAIAAVVIVVAHVERADAVASLAVVILIEVSAWGVLRDAGRILLQAAPAELDLASVREHLGRVNHVCDVHDLHAWTLTTGEATLSAHVVVTDDCFHEGHAPQILDELQACLATHFGLTHATFQIEPATHVDHEDGVHD
jgi:cobalt-zinc-cadmium efflux system protein